MKKKYFQAYVKVINIINKHLEDIHESAFEAKIIDWADKYWQHIKGIKPSRMTEDEIQTLKEFGCDLFSDNEIDIPFQRGTGF
jgi:hypothetical protein